MVNKRPQISTMGFQLYEILGHAKLMYSGRKGLGGGLISCTGDIIGVMEMRQLNKVLIRQLYPIFAHTHTS